MSNPLLVSTEWLSEHINDEKIRIVDTRWYLLPPKNGREEYLRDHIPGAVYMNIDGDLASPVGSGPGRHPLPTAEMFSQTASRVGIDANTHVITYDDAGGSVAARLWWLLRYFGHVRVSLLDGGITQWIIEGRPLTANVPLPSPKNFVARPHPERVVNQKDVDKLRSDSRALLLDSRVAERYEGKAEPIDPRAGHIPGAKHAPLASNMRGPHDLRFADVATLRKRFDRLGADRAKKIIAYCGSGVNACQNIFALTLAGFNNVFLYEGSWSDWCSDPNRPAAIGKDLTEQA